MVVRRVGEKFIQWTDKTPPLDDILDSVSMYWFTESFPRAIYGYRQFFDRCDMDCLFTPKSGRNCVRVAFTCLDLYESL